MPLSFFSFSCQVMSSFREIILIASRLCRVFSVCTNFAENLMTISRIMHSFINHANFYFFSFCQNFVNVSTYGGMSSMHGVTG